MAQALPPAQTGVTIMQMDAGLDTGDMLLISRRMDRAAGACLQSALAHTRLHGEAPSGRLNWHRCPPPPWNNYGCSALQFQLLIHDRQAAAGGGVLMCCCL
jgi:hypothetical protein